MFVGNVHAAPQSFAIMLTNCKFGGSGTYNVNRVGCDSESCKFPNFQISKLCDRGTFVRKVVKRLGIVISIWKESKDLHVASAVTKEAIVEVSRRNYANILTLLCPNEIIMCQNARAE